MSLRGTCTALSVFGIPLSHMTTWRNLQEQADALEKQRHWKPVRVLGIDGLYPLGKGRQQPVLMAVDLGNGQPVAIGHVNEYDPWAVRRFLEPLVKRLGVSVIVSDDLITFHRVTEKIGCGTSGVPVPCTPLGGTYPLPTQRNGTQRLAMGTG